jgi:predicted small secreted protein
MLEKGSITMKKNILLFIPLFLFTAFVIASCSWMRGKGLGGGVSGSGNIQTETRDTGVFDVVSIEYPGAEIVIQQGEKASVEIEADDNLLPQLSTEALSGTLTIKSLAADWKASVNPSQPVKIVITAKDLNEIILSAPVGNVEMNDWHADMLKFVLSGGAELKLNDIQVDLLDIDLSGAGNIDANGTASDVNLILSGVGSFNAADLKSNRATIDLSGMGSAIVQVEEDLAATLTGAGSIKYYGTPHVEQNVTGAGSVEPAE